MIYHKVFLLIIKLILKFTKSGVAVNREEAVNLLKEFIKVCGSFIESGVMLMPPNADDVLSHGYQLHIKANLAHEFLTCIEPIVKKHNLAMANETKKALLVIYRPM